MQRVKENEWPHTVHIQTCIFFGLSRKSIVGPTGCERGHEGRRDCASGGPCLVGGGHAGEDGIILVVREGKRGESICCLFFFFWVACIGHQRQQGWHSASPLLHQRTTRLKTGGCCHGQGGHHHADITEVIETWHCNLGVHVVLSRRLDHQGRTAWGWRWRRCRCEAAWLQGTPVTSTLDSIIGRRSDGPNKGRWTWR